MLRRGRRLLSGGGECPPWTIFGAHDKAHSFEHSGSTTNPTTGVVEYEYKKGTAALWFFLVIYMFLGIAIVCDDFFVASLESISEALHLSDDVAGATFMAAGSSAPELFSSLVSMIQWEPPSANGVLDSTSDLGVGTIVGSAVFNILVIIGATAICTGKVIDLDWRPIARDVTFYTLSVVTLVAFFNNGKVEWWEGLISMFLYVGYVVFMKYNVKYMDLMAKWFPSIMEHQETRNSYGKGELEDGPLPSKSTRPTSFSEKGNNNKVAPGDGAEGGDDEDDKSPFTPPEKLYEWPMYLLSLPWYAMFTYTIPPCAEEKWKKWYQVTFGMSIVWIMAISWAMVEWTARIGCILGIPNIVMGVTVLAAGTSVPDALSSIMVAKNGMGDMAVANAIGSNVFDIWIGLGFPWFAILLAKDADMTIQKKDLVPNVLILLGIVIFYIGAITIDKFRLRPLTGWIFIAVYALYAGYQIGFVWQMDIYGTQ